MIRELVSCLVRSGFWLSQYVFAPRSNHWAGVLGILGYVCGTIHLCLLPSSTSSLTLQAYADADWARDISDPKSTSGLCVFLGRFSYLLEK